MPTQQTNLTSGRDAAALGRDLSIALKDALVAPRDNAAIAALDGASPETHAAGPPAAPTRSVLSLLQRYWRAFQERRRCHRLQVSLRDLSDRQLIDIGVTSADIEHIDAQRAIDRLRDGTAYLWIRSRGVM